MKEGRIPKDVMKGELAIGHHLVSHPVQCFKDVCKYNLKLTGIDTDSWELLAYDRSGWRRAVREEVKRGEETRSQQLEDRRQRRKETTQEAITAMTGHQSSLHHFLRKRLLCKDRTGEPFQTAPGAVLANQGAYYYYQQ